MDSTEATSYPPVVEDLTVDVAVVGGGIAGLCTAWELVQTGRSVAVLEADRIAAGVTGYTTAKLTALHTLVYSEFGAEAARLYAASQQDAVDHVARTATTLGIECQFERCPAYTYVHSEDMVGQVRDEAAAASEAGLRASLVTETELPFPVAAAVRVEDQAQFHPRRYLLGLADAITARTGVIYERTRVVDLDEGPPHTLTTESGARVRADSVVVATHYPVFDRALLFARLVPQRHLVVAAAIPAAQDPHGTYITPEANTRSVRTAPYTDGQRLLIVTGEMFTPGAGEVTGRYETLTDWTLERFPAAQLRYRWAAQDNSTTDKMPYIGVMHAGADSVYVATGFNGWGMSNGVLAARLLTGSITGDPLPWTDLYDPRRLHPVAEAGPLLKAQSKVAKHFIGDRLRSSHVDSIADIAPGAGAVVRVAGQRCAVFRDDTETLHAVSATCTHLGCLVAFNDAERAWECPCHGSRFSTDGAVIHGPATRPLEPRRLPDQRDERP
ncbi:glycine/D-amino acid oxidase-like deaminating enzyme [Nocardia bhagyanarayanae]|uniref:Glycine/D-amino acid oxidase-like deaminating enzyme n=2 Tax=Nocardia bhagyanarayanae TaxID=1215925 RepID=A0A543FI85_9NOCA|nr:glycine/D-amino acid oxidase-like deaminating enzyme [Nocardia bhagyanarayanae]